MSGTGLDNRLNIEDQFILRLPPELAARVSSMVQSGKLDDITLKFPRTFSSAPVLASSLSLFLSEF